MRFKREDHYLDTKTGLQWYLKSLERMDWDTAMKTCEELKDRWRSPTIKELLTLVDYSISHPATELPGMQSYGYWSSTTYESTPNYAWLVLMFVGYVYSDGKDSTYYVWPVRG